MHGLQKNKSDMRIKIKPNSLKYISHNKRTHLLSDTSMPIHCKHKSLDTKDMVFVISRIIHCAIHQAKGIKHVTNENFSYKASLSNQKLIDKNMSNACVLNVKHKTSDLETAFQNEQKESCVMIKFSDITCLG